MYRELNTYSSLKRGTFLFCVSLSYWLFFSQCCEKIQANVTKEERVYFVSSVEGSVPDDGELEEAGS